MRRNLILFDDDSWEHLLPLTYTRPTADLRCGALTIAEKWALALDANVSFITQEYLSDLYPINIEEDNYVIAGNILPNERLVRLINDLDPNEALMREDELVAARLSRVQFDHLIHNEQIDELNGYMIDDTPVTRILRVHDLFRLADDQIRWDAARITNQQDSCSTDGNQCIGEDIFIGEGSEVKCAILDASAGPIYIGRHVKVLPGAMIKGPVAIGDNSVVKMGAKIYGGTALGPHCKVGGELSNVLMQGYSNKGHDGYLGNAVIGEWCNLGADTNCSNLRNDYGEVTLYNHASNAYEETGLQFCGLIMGDHSKCGINTMFNTGSVVGVSCNIYGGGFQDRFIPSFSWGSSQVREEFRLDKSKEVAKRMRARRGLDMCEKQVALFDHVFAMTSNQRAR